MYHRPPCCANNGRTFLAVQGIYVAPRSTIALTSSPFRHTYNPIHSYFLYFAIHELANIKLGSRYNFETLTFCKDL
mgnify:CR=1 FL=1